MQRLVKLWLSLKQFYADHIDPDGIQPLHALRTTIAGVFAIIFYRAIDWPQAYWILVSTVLILQTYVGNTPQTRFTFLALTGVLSAICTYVASFCGQSFSGLAIFLTISTFITLYSAVISANVGDVAFYINLFCLSSGALPVDPTNSWQRAVCVFLGGVIAIVVCACCWPERLSEQIRDRVADNLRRLSALNLTLNMRSQDEQAIVVRRNRMMRGLQRTYQLIPSNEVQDQQILRKIEYLYEIILHFYQLKCFVSEQKILRLLEKEIIIIGRRVSWLLRGMVTCLQEKGKSPNSKKFNDTLRAFEKLYQRHLPQFNEEQLLAFTIYIDNIHKLEKTVTDLLGLMEKKYYRS